MGFWLLLKGLRTSAVAEVQQMNIYVGSISWTATEQRLTGQILTVNQVQPR